MRQIWTLILLVLLSLPVYSHGIISKKISGGNGIQVMYDDQSPLSFAETKVFSPKNESVPFQVGNTDKNGVFLFFPDCTGKWKIVVNDGLGHGSVQYLDIDLQNPANSESPTGTFSRWQKIVIGLSIIFGITGILTVLQSRKKPRGN